MKSSRGAEPAAPASKEEPRRLLEAGIAAHKAGDLGSARRAYEQALRLWPDHPHALHLLGVLCDAEGRHEDAVGSIRRALPALDGKAHVHNNLGTALRHAGRPAEARRHYERALSLSGRYPQAHYNLGLLLIAPGPLQDLAAARQHLRQAVAAQPALAAAWLELARLNRREGKLAAAIETYRRVLELRPDDVGALIDLGALYQVTLQVPRAIPVLERACRLAPESPLAWFNLAQARAETGDKEGAEGAHRRVLELAPDNLDSRLAAVKNERDRCDWTTWEQTVADLSDLDAAAIRQAPAPFLLNLFPLPAATHQKVARAYAQRFERRGEELGGPLSMRSALPKPRLRLGFVSADFRHHPVGHLCHRLFAALDRRRFEVFAYSLLPVDDEVTAAVRAGCDLFRGCARWDDRAIARRIADDEVDVLIDLTGYTTYSRPAILAQRPAPLQLQHLGYVNTMAARFIDYQVVDRIVVGREQRRSFSEHLIVLPDCLLPASPLGELAMASHRPSRRREGLPEGRPVLCSFNAPSKLDPPTFDAWMAILGRAAEAILWLFDGGEPELPANLRREAAARGIDPDRLFFAPKIPYADHLQRYRVADLFLDSFTYNGGATAVDALRQGLPVLTRLGEAPLSRLGASVVTAAGLPDLIAASSRGFVDRAISLLASPGELRRLRDRAEAARASSPLFDLERWVQGYSAGMETAWALAVEGRRGDVEVAVDGAAPAGRRGSGAGV